MSKFDIKVKAFGDHALLIEWPNRIDDQILDDIIRFTSLVLTQEGDDLINHTPAYNSLLLQYNSVIDLTSKRKTLLNLYNSAKNDAKIESNTWHIPVCYDEQFGIDLPLFAEKGLSKAEVIRLHTSTAFRVFMIGFLPGFLYLGGLPEPLHMHRKEKPRIHVAKGSVAIGGEQTGIYPMASPGGWQIIGRTPLSLFEISLEPPTPIRQGDKIQFYPIDAKTYSILTTHEEKPLAQGV